MGDIVITASVSGASGDLMSELQDHIMMLMENTRERFIVVKQANCCDRCAATDNPEDFMDGGLHADCRCRVVEIGDEKIPETEAAE